MGGINPNAKLTLPVDYSRKPETFAKNDHTGGFITGGLAGLLAAGTIYKSAVVEGTKQGAVGALVGGALFGGTVGMGLSNRLNRRNIPVTVNENGKDATVYVSHQQWHVIQAGLKEGYTFQGIKPDQFKGEIPKPVTH